jgi:uncharacterized protein
VSLLLKDAPMMRPALLLAAALLAAAPAEPAPPLADGAPLPKPAAPAAAATTAAGAATLSWEELIPEDERKRYVAGPPPPVHDYLSGESGLAAQQPQDFAVNGKLDGRVVRMPGFIVPLEVDSSGKVIEFFLVPYFGACIHVPPPPPNQMLYVTLREGVSLESMYAAYWVTGRIAAHTERTALGAAAYSLSATRVEDYKY